MFYHYFLQMLGNRDPKKIVVPNLQKEQKSGPKRNRPHNGYRNVFARSASILYTLLLGYCAVLVCTYNRAIFLFPACDFRRNPHTTERFFLIIDFLGDTNPRNKRSFKKYKKYKKKEKKTHIFLFCTRFIITVL